MKIKEVLLDVLEAALGTGPMIARLGNASGDSTLRSRTTSPNGVINAQASKMVDDMERLILAAFVATRSIFTDATMFGQPDDYSSVFTGPDKQPRDGSGDFVVSSPDIQTFSLTGIVTLVVILGTLMLANIITWACIRFHHTNPSASTETSQDNRGTGNTGQSHVNVNVTISNKGTPADRNTGDVEDANGGPKDRWTRYHVLAAAQLFRCLYEVDGKEANWSCEKAVPSDSDDIKFKLLQCKNSKNKCTGHIKTDEIVTANPKGQNGTGANVTVTAGTDSETAAEDSANPVNYSSP